MRLTVLTCSRLSRSAVEYSIMRLAKTTIMQNWYDMTCGYKHMHLEHLAQNFRFMGDNNIT